MPIYITSLGAREDIYAAAHSSGGVVLHDVISNAFAHKAISKGADGLVAVAAGAGGHAGTKSPFALVQEIRQCVCCARVWRCRTHDTACACGSRALWLYPAPSQQAAPCLLLRHNLPSPHPPPPFTLKRA